MTGVLTPLVPPLALPTQAGKGVPERLGSRRPLPLPALRTARTRATVYRLAAVDDRGRVADHTVVQALGWRPGTRLDIRVADGVITVAAGDDGLLAVTGQGFVRLPATVRRGCGIAAGDRVLLAAEPADGILTLYPPATMDTLVAHTRTKPGCAAALLGCDAA